MYLKGKRRGAHRVAYELTCGPIPKPLVIDHGCREPSCCNPKHMEPVTIAENTRRGMSPSAVAHRENRCTRGHQYRPETTIVFKDGTRQCRICRNKIAREKYHEAKAAAGVKTVRYRSDECRNGHRRTPESTLKDGACRTCKYDTNRRSRERKVS